MLRAHALRSPLAAFFCLAAFAAAASALNTVSARSRPSEQKCYGEQKETYLCLSNAALSLSFLAWAELF